MPSFTDWRVLINTSPSQSEQNVDAKLFIILFLIMLISLSLRLVFMFHSDLLVEEAYYWNYANHLDIGYLDHPPMVAMLIKITTLLFGVNEFAVRLSALVCWFFSAWFVFKLTHLIRSDAGIYAVILLSIFPFFFLQSMVITPDDPLILCWSATLYSLFRAVVKNETKYWYASGLWMGLGLLSKYTMVLLGFTTLIYITLVPEYRFWFKRKEPYLCALIAMVCFIPVILWNATHEWASFAFQSTRRLNAQDHFSFDQYLGLLLLFLTPLGLLSLWKLYRPQPITTLFGMEDNTKRFLQCYTLVPLLVFGVFSLKHQIKFNWIGPGLLATIPWISIGISNAFEQKTKTVIYGWMLTTLFLILGYGGLIFTGTTGQPAWIHQAFLTKYIDWNNLTGRINQVAQEAEQETHQSLTIIPLDSYNIGSELNFYQQKQWNNGSIEKVYPIIGSHVFGQQSLMFQYWSNHFKLSDKVLLLVSKNPSSFFADHIKQMTQRKSSIQEIWSKSPKNGSSIEPYYYQIVKIKSKAD